MKTPYSTLLTAALIATLIACLPAAYSQTSTAEFKTEPDKTMAAGYESFLKRDTKSAAENIDKAADFVKKQSQHVAEGSKAGMEKAGADLDKLAEGVKNGTVKSGDELKAGFAKVDHEMATCWHNTADEARKQGKDSTADLNKAGASLAGAAKWSGHQLDEGTQKTLDEVKKAGEAAQNGVKAGADQVDKWFKGIGHGIDDLAHKL